MKLKQEQTRDSRVPLDSRTELLDCCYIIMIALRLPSFYKVVQVVSY